MFTYRHFLEQHGNCVQTSPSLLLLAARPSALQRQRARRLGVTSMTSRIRKYRHILLVVASSMNSPRERFSRLIRRSMVAVKSLYLWTATVRRMERNTTDTVAVLGIIVLLRFACSARPPHSCPLQQMFYVRSPYRLGPYKSIFYMISLPSARGSVNRHSHDTSSQLSDCDSRSFSTQGLSFRSRNLCFQGP